MSNRVCSCAALLCLVLGSFAQADIFIDDYTAATNDRFTNDSAFILNGFDLSGVGQATNGRWATAIGRNIVISAAHFAPSGEVSFFTNNDPTLPAVTRSIDASLSGRVAGTDLWLGVLDSNLPASITHYSYATEAIVGTTGATTGAGIYQGRTAFLFGRSPADNPAFRDQAVGRNVVSGFAENVAFQGQPNVDSLMFNRDSPGDQDYRTHEAFFATGDSGGPTFVEIGGELRLVGTNAFTFNGGVAGSGINYTGNQSTEITTFITANAVPEPSSLALVLIGGLFVTSRRQARLC